MIFAFFLMITSRFIFASIDEQPVGAVVTSQSKNTSVFLNAILL